MNFVMSTLKGTVLGRQKELSDMSTLYNIASEPYSMLPWRTVTARGGKRAYRRDIFYCTDFVSFSNNALHMRIWA